MNLVKKIENLRMRLNKVALCDLTDEKMIEERYKLSTELDKLILEAYEQKGENICK